MLEGNPQVANKKTSLFFLSFFRLAKNENSGHRQQIIITLRHSDANKSKLNSLSGPRGRGLVRLGGFLPSGSTVYSIAYASSFPPEAKKNNP